MSDTTTETTEKRKLSEVLRTGAQKVPQTFDCFRDEFGYCALGTIDHELGTSDIQIGNYLSERIRERTEVDLHLRVEDLDLDRSKLPSYVHKRDNISNLIVYLNDKEKWTREQIADQLESIGF